MRLISPALTAAQKAASQAPYYKVTVQNAHAGVTRHCWTRLYTGIDADTYHAAAMPGDGSLIRIRTDAANQLYRQRVTTPGPTSTYSTWTDWGCTAYAIALCTTAAKAFCFRVDAVNGHLYGSQSTDSGATWDAWVDFGALNLDYTTRLACCFKSATEAILLFSIIGAVWATRLVANTWEPPILWTNTAASITGLAVHYLGDWNIAITGTQATTLDPHVWQCLYGDGYSASSGTWSALKEITMANAASGVSFHFPSLANPDVFRLTFVETYTGLAPYSRPYITNQTPTSEYLSCLWREPVPFNFTSNFGLAYTWSGSNAWLSTAAGVWRAPRLDTPLDITADALEITASDSPDAGTATIVLRNDHGAYNTPGAGTVANITLGAQINLSPGYQLPTGPASSPGPSYWIQSIDHQTGAAKSTLTITAGSGALLLDTWKARRQFTWAAGSKNIWQLLSFIFARAGIAFSSYSYSDAMVNNEPAFTINPGESAKAAAARLFAMVPDVLLWETSTAYTKNPLTSDTADYAYGTDHPIITADYRNQAKPANRAQAYTFALTDIMAEDFDWTQITLLGDRLQQAHDFTLITEAEALARAQAMLRTQAVTAPRGAIAAQVNCALQIHDVIAITDAQTGLSAALRRVSAIATAYSATKGRYIQQIGLTEV